MKTAYFLKQATVKGLSRFKLAIYLWLIILATALLAIAPLMAMVRKNLGHLHYSQPAFMPFELHLVEIFIANQNIFTPYLYLLLTLVFLFSLLSILINGGIFGGLAGPDKKITFGNFLHDGCRYFWQFFLTFLLSLPFFLLLIMFFRLLVLPLKLWQEGAVTGWPTIIGSNLSLLIFILLWTIFKLIFDLVRIIIVSESKKAISALMTAFSFLKKHFFQLWGLYLLTGFVLTIISFLIILLLRLPSSNHFAGVLILIILGQLFIFWRIFSRLVLIGLETGYYSENRGEQ